MVLIMILQYWSGYSSRVLIEIEGIDQDTKVLTIIFLLQDDQVVLMLCYWSWCIDQDTKVLIMICSHRSGYPGIDDHISLTGRPGGVDVKVLIMTLQYWSGYSGIDDHIPLTGWPGGAAVHSDRAEGADQAMSVLRGLREPPLLPGDHVQRSGTCQSINQSINQSIHWLTDWLRRIYGHTQCLCQ